MSDRARTGRALRLVVPSQPLADPDPATGDAATEAARSARPAGGHVSGPVPRPLPQPPAGVPWPSGDWLAHYSACPLGRRCRHRFEFPGWWLAMNNHRHIPLHADPDEALQAAVAMINGFKGHPALLPEPLVFAQQLVIDSLAIAPTPIGVSWMRITLGAVAALVRWAHMTGQPLTREHLLSEETRYRFMATRTDLAKGTANLYWVRLELIAEFLNSVTPNRILPKPTSTEEAPITPLTPADETDVWLWASTIRGRQGIRRHQVMATIVLGLGCGLTGGEVIRCLSEHVAVTETGVHVTATKPNGTTHTVTCRQDWETRLANLVADIAPSRQVVAPHRDAISHNALLLTCQRARANSPVPFNSIRLRNTWLCHHLSAGTPLKVLMAASGMKEANHLHNLLPLMAEESPEAAAQMLRGI